MNNYYNLPPQQISYKKKGKEWRKQHLDWADSKTFFNYNLVRKSVEHKKINYDLVNGILHMKDVESVINPDFVSVTFNPEQIQHIPIMNENLNLLKGEEINRVFDVKVIVTNANSISEIENKKKNEIYERLQSIIMNTVQNEDEYNKAMEEMNDYYTYQWQDIREIRANALLNHYIKELNINALFSEGFMDGLTVGEEIYQCDIVGGEPVINKLNPLKIRVFRNGYSNKIEDADVIIYEDYWSPSKIIDTFYDIENRKELLEYLDKMPDTLGSGSSDGMNNIDERYGMINAKFVGEDGVMTEDGVNAVFGASAETSLLPFDMEGNVRVVRMYWKSRKKIKKIKSYNPETGEEEYNFYHENYVIDPDKGEEETVYWVNQAWEGTKIGKNIYVNIRPRPVQYNRLDNPSRCHFGIVGSIYNLNDSKPYSLVDMMKPYNYLYDIVNYRLQSLIARNYGKLVRLDFSKKPKGWDVEKWIYYMKSLGISFEDSFNEGNYGAGTGKLAGALNNNSSGVVDAELSSSVAQYINLLSYLDQSMSKLIGISEQRKGTIANRETVGGVERATIQSSNITEWIFNIHNDVKKRALECFLETAKIALRGRTKKFQYILSDFSNQITEIDGDEFAENDYGLVVDCDRSAQQLEQNLSMLVQAGLQNQAIDFSTAIKLFSSISISEKVRMIENSERKNKEQAQQQQEQQMQIQQQQIQAQQEAAQQQIALTREINAENNQTKIEVALINSQAEADRLELMNAGGGDDRELTKESLAISRDKLSEAKRQFDLQNELNKKKAEDNLKIQTETLKLKKQKQAQDVELKKKQINKTNSKTN